MLRICENLVAVFRFSVHHRQHNPVHSRAAAPCQERIPFKSEVCIWFFLIHYSHGNQPLRDNSSFTFLEHISDYVLFCIGVRLVRPQKSCGLSSAPVTSNAFLWKTRAPVPLTKFFFPSMVPSLKHTLACLTSKALCTSSGALWLSVCALLPSGHP